jgi:hypothetical protein
MKIFLRKQSICFQWLASVKVSARSQNRKRMSLIAQDFHPDSKVGDQQRSPVGTAPRKPGSLPPHPTTHGCDGQTSVVRTWRLRREDLPDRGGGDRRAGRDCALGSPGSACQAAAAQAAASGVALAGVGAAACLASLTWRTRLWDGCSWKAGLKRCCRRREGGGLRWIRRTRPRSEVGGRSEERAVNSQHVTAWERVS